MFYPFLSCFGIFCQGCLRNYFINEYLAGSLAGGISAEVSLAQEIFFV
jgi:hypothetical protein